MTGPVDFIDPADLVQDPGRDSSSTWPESSTLPQRAIKLILDAGVAYYGQTDKQQSIRRALPFLEATELPRVERLVRERPMEVVHGFARAGVNMPTMAIVLGAEENHRDELFLNDYATTAPDTYNDAGGGRVELHSVGFQTKLRLVFYAENPDELIYWYELVKFILIQSRLLLGKLGLDIPTLAGADLQSLPEFTPELIYMRVMTLTFRTRQVFAQETSLITEIDAFILQKLTEQQASLGAFVGRASERDP